MAASPETVSIAMFCDFENVALGVRDAKLEKFDIKPVLERLLLKGSIVVKKAYCDWDRYKPFKAGMHEANFELIEIPHVRQSGKNSADIRMVVDALDLCYTKAHVNTFVIVSGDSDFSPLVSKLRENAKYVIGVGVRQSTSDLLIANCDEFIFYDDLVREHQRKAARRDPKAAQSAPRRSPEELEARRSEAVELAVETLDALVAERGDSGKIWASMLKEALKRRKPDFAESTFGFRSFGNLLEEAQSRGLIELGRDEKSGAFVSRSALPIGRSEAPVAEPEHGAAGGTLPEVVAEVPPVSADAVAATALAPAADTDAKPRGPAKRRGRGKRTAVDEAPGAVASPAPEVASAPEVPAVADAALPAVAPEAKAKPAPRNRRPRKPKAAAKNEGGAAS